MSSTMLSCSSTDGPEADYPDKFVNSDPAFERQSNPFEILMAFIKAEERTPKPTFDFPMHTITTEQLIDEREDVVYRLGHSSMLMKLNGSLVITDPVFSDRASPVQFMGPKRFHPAPISIEDLPEIDVVVISHDHYDHLDKMSVKALSDKTGLFLVPLKIGAILKDWGVPTEKVVELKWWESRVVNGIDFTLTPTQHFSGRGLTDRDSTLWGSWVMLSPEKRVYFSGDSGYFDGFKEIGEKYGPFNLTMIETGAYNSLWANIHMFPEQSVQAHIDLKGSVMLPIHNSTFDLAMHDWKEPMKKALEISNERGVTMVSPEIGQRLAIGETLPVVEWWNQE
ncbi:hydrolase [Grimontia sp. AD028]|uniref:MBL fold metallo-hydrolase n=1 Tax=Grimontia sp. AD028 TaxID=1581149 RepID=UPI00061B5A76|nr:MBL fold metallo-hydrolase [Grimontia sp. AD028]KKD59862.1 hydrolase [Grimontia sp. AD028]